MNRKEMTYSNAGFQRLVSTKLLPFANMSDGELAVWEVWLNKHYEDEFPTPRERSFFRRNRAQCYAEKLWRNKEIPF